MSKIFDKNAHGVSQLISSPNMWAYDMWKTALANHWVPHSIDMTDDIAQWKNGALTEDEMLLVKRTLGLFASGESMVSNSVAMVEFQYITDGSCRQYLLKKQFEESLHNSTVEVCCSSFNLDIKEVAEAYKSIPSIKLKNKFLNKSLDSFDSDFDISSNEGKRKFLRNLAVYYLVCEGTWFFSNFALILSLGRQGKLSGLCDQIKYTLRDESLHVEFGANVINRAKEDYPQIWTKGFEKEIVSLIQEGVELELRYAKEILPNGILGVNYELLEKYIKFLANLRLQSIGVGSIFPEKSNPFPWLAEAQDTSSMSAFFERRETSYQSTSSLEDDF